MRRTSLLGLVVLFSLSAGCYNAKIKAPVQPVGEKYQEAGVSLFWGITNTTTIAVECVHGFAYAETYHPWWGVFLVAPLTLGIVTPIRKVYQCAAPPQAAAPAGAPATAPQIILMQAPAAQAAPAATTAPAKSDDEDEPPAKPKKKR